MNVIAPQGLGTADVESLSSYVQRLAEANGTYPGQLVFRYLAWMDRGRGDQIGIWSERPGRVRVGFNLNSFGLADVWLRLLQRATGRADLLTLTTRVWDGAFPTRDFHAQGYEWCPFCLQEDRIPYGRLRWSIRNARVCLRHGRYLQQRCAQCGKPPPILHERSLVTRCPWCAVDLRVPLSITTTIQPSDFDQYAAREVGMILQLAADCHRDVRWEPARAIRSIARAKGIRTAGALAREVGMPKLTVWYWLHLRTSPSLTAMLRVYFHFGVSLAAHLFSANLGFTSPSQPVPAQREFMLRGRKGPRKLDWPVIMDVLRMEAERPIKEAESFINVSRQLGIARRTLRAHAPALCRAISRRRRERQKLERARREQVLVCAIVAGLRTFASLHRIPTWKELEHAMRSPGLFNSRYARRALRLACEPSAWRSET